MAYVKAVRRAVPLITSIAGPSGSGKTLGALLMAAGLAAPGGRVAMIDTENMRGTLYADDPLLIKALPDGFGHYPLDAPYSPARYLEKIKEVERDNVSVCVIDSFTHEWEGLGGCAEIAETKKRGGMPNWALAKLEHKKLLNHLLSTNMHLIFCLRARDKVKIVKVGGKEEIIQVGIQPVTEKNFVFEMLLSLQVDEKTHQSSPIKVPAMLSSFFPTSGVLLSKEHGQRIREWNEGGQQSDPAEPLRKRARFAAESGVAAYQEFWGALTAAQRKAIGETQHADNKAIAEEADFLAEQERLSVDDVSEPVPA